MKINSKVNTPHGTGKVMFNHKAGKFMAAGVTVKLDGKSGVGDCVFVENSKITSVKA